MTSFCKHNDEHLGSMMGDFLTG